MDADKYLKSLFYLDSNYDIIFFHISHTCPDKVIINDPLKRCRFCDKSEPAITFKKVAHAIPELIGNKKIISNNECDGCNEKVSVLLEDSLGKYLGIWRTMMQVKGKKGVVSYKSPDGISRIDLTQKGVEIKSFIDNPIMEISEEQKTIKITGFNQPYTPIAVYKAFVKMAISIMPYELLDYFRDTKKWLLEDSHIITLYDIQPLVTFLSFVPGPNPFGSFTVMLYKRKNDALPVPFMQLVVAFNNLCFQIYIPCKAKDIILDGKTIGFHQFPHPFILNSPFGQVVNGPIDLSGKNLVRNEKKEITMSFGEYEKYTE